MQRREFMRVAAGMAVAGALSGVSRYASASEMTVDALHRKMYERMRRFVKTPHGDIAYMDAGHVSRVALFLHGFPLNGFQWRGVIDRLCMYRRCIAPDLMGMGSTKTNLGQDVGPESQVSMVIALLDKLGIERVDVVANDSGGAIAQLLVVNHPERVRSMMLTNCDTEMQSPPPALLPVIALAKQGRYADEWLVPWLANKTLARSQAGIGGMCYSKAESLSDEAIEMYFAPLVATAQSKAFIEAYAIALERNPLAGTEAQLRRSSVGTRIVWGMSDTIFSPSNAKFLDDVFSQSRGIRRLEGGKLFWPEEYPEIVAEEAISLWNTSLLCPDNQC